MTQRIGPALAEAFRITFDDAAADWFPPVGPTVDALSAAEAARVGADWTGSHANAPWQVLEHLRIGYAVWGEFLGSGRFDPAQFGGGHEWDPIHDSSDHAWDDARAAVRECEAAFRAVIASLDDEALLEPLEALRGGTRFDVILSTLAHLGYHAGELATLRPPDADRAQTAISVEASAVR